MKVSKTAFVTSFGVLLDRAADQLLWGRNEVLVVALCGLMLLSVAGPADAGIIGIDHFGEMAIGSSVALVNGDAGASNQHIFWENKSWKSIREAKMVSSTTSNLSHGIPVAWTLNWGWQIVPLD